MVSEAKGVPDILKFGPEDQIWLGVLSTKSK